MNIFVFTHLLYFCCKFCYMLTSWSIWMEMFFSVNGNVLPFLWTHFEWPYTGHIATIRFWLMQWPPGVLGFLINSMASKWSTKNRFVETHFTEFLHQTLLFNFLFCLNVTHIPPIRWNLTKKWCELRKYFLCETNQYLSWVILVKGFCL